MWDFWKRHKRKVYVSLGVFGSGYLLYKLYNARTHRLRDLQRQLEYEREHDEVIKAQIQAHFLSVQEIANSTTLPHAMHLLNSKLAENLDLAQLTNKLMQGKGQPNSLSASEKLALWDNLKIQSFTKMMTSLWAITMLSLYIRVQVNILGRHLYIDTARDQGSSLLLVEDGIIDRSDEQQFLECSDYLSKYGLLSLISSMEAAISEVLRGKQLKDIFDVSLLHETIIQTLDTFMNMGSPHHWVLYLMPENAKAYRLLSPSSSSGLDLSRSTKFDSLISEAQTVLSSAEFGNTMDVSLRTMVTALLEDLISECGENNLISGMPLAKILPRIAHMDQLLLKEHTRNKYTQNLQSMPEVERFFTVLYSSMPD